MTSKEQLLSVGKNCLGGRYYLVQMKSVQDHKILREYVKQILREDDYGGMMMAAGDMNPYGVHIASNNDLYKTFIKPFVDVVDVAAGKTKELSQKTQTLGKIAFETIGSTIFPWLSSDYAEIFQEEKAQIDKIKSQYSEVYQATWDAFQTNDVAWTAFFCYPGAVFASSLARKTPLVTLKMLSVFSGGTMDNFLSRAQQKFSTNGKKSNNNNDYGGDKLPSPTWESVLHEDDATKRKTKKKTTLADVLTNEKVIKKALSSPTAQRIQKETREVVRGTLKSVFEHAQAVMSSKSFEELQKKIGKPLKGLEKLKGMQPEARQAAEAQVLSTLKKSMTSFYVKNLEAQVKQALDAGIPQNSGFVKDYVNVIQKIKSL